MTISELWPVRRIVVRSPTLELRVPNEADLEAAARVAARGIYDPQNRFIPRSSVAGSRTRLPAIRVGCARGLATRTLESPNGGGCR
jgi:hypothetical protein